MIKNKDNANKDFTHYVYSCFDTVSKKYRGLFYSGNDAEMIRTSLPTILYDYPLRDIEIYKIGTFNENTGEIVFLKHKLISTDSYTFPHSRLSCKGDDLSPSELDEGIKKNKNTIISNLSEKKENENMEA